MNQHHDDCGQQPPVDRAKNFATFRRLKGGYPEELRIGIDAYNGHPYVSLRVWVPGAGSGMWPKRVGCSLRRSEIIPAIEALKAIAEELGLVDEPPVRATPDMYPPDRRGPRRRVDEAELRRLASGPKVNRDFDEFGGN